MEPVRQGRGAGAGFFGVGAAFIAVALAGDQPGLLGVGLAFLGLALGARLQWRAGKPR